MTINNIDSISQVGALKQRILTRRIRKNVELLKAQTGSSYIPTYKEKYVKDWFYNTYLDLSGVLDLLLDPLIEGSSDQGIDPLMDPLQLDPYLQNHTHPSLVLILNPYLNQYP